MAAPHATAQESTAAEDEGTNRRLQLLVVSSDTYPPRRVDVCVLFGEELAARRHKIDWILQSEAPCDRAYEVSWGGGTVFVGPTDLGTSLPRRIRKHVRGITHDCKLFRLMRSGNYDAVEVKDKFIAGVFALVAARLYGKCFIYWLSYPFPEHYLHSAHTGDARYPLLYRIRGTAFKWLLYRLLLPAATHVFVQSEQMRRDIAAEGVPLDRMTAVPMGIPTRDIPQGWRRTERTVIPEGERAFLYLGTLARVRRLDFLVRVLALVRKSLPDAKLYIVGRGEDLDDEQLLLDEAARLNVGTGLVMTGQLPRDEALQYVKEADVCVSPFYPTPILNSTSPTKLVEYMAMGKAVVANDHPEQRLMIESSGAGYSVPWDEHAFAEAVASLLNDPVQCASMGERGRRYVTEHRSYERIADVVESELLRVLVCGEGTVNP